MRPKRRLVRECHRSGHGSDVDDPGGDPGPVPAQPSGSPPPRDTSEAVQIPDTLRLTYQKLRLLYQKFLVFLPF